MSIRTPKYRRHKGSGQALVEVNGERTYLGKYGSEASKEKYRRIIAEWLATGQTATASNDKAASTSASSRATISVSELILGFWRHAKQRYVKSGEATSELRSYRTALRPVCDLYGSQPVTAFGPLALIACREVLVKQGITRKRVNGHVGRVRHAFKWGVAREVVPESVWRALGSVEGLRVGEAKETEPIKPAPEEHVLGVEPFVTPPIWAMVQFQLWTGCRPEEACRIRAIDIDTSRPVWEYRPHTHKTEHHGKERIVYIGPHAQAILVPWLKRRPAAYLFSPRDGRAACQAKRDANRKTPRPSVKRASQRKSNPKRTPGEFYRTTSYDHAIQRGCRRAAVPAWTPNQLRHTAATRIRAVYGIEAARIILGHASAVTSEIYAEIDQEKAREIMHHLG